MGPPPPRRPPPPRPLRRTQRPQQHRRRGGGPRPPPPPPRQRRRPRRGGASRRPRRHRHRHGHRHRCCQLAHLQPLRLYCCQPPWERSTQPRWRSPRPRHPVAAVVKVARTAPRCPRQRGRPQTYGRRRGGAPLAPTGRGVSPLSDGRGVPPPRARRGEHQSQQPVPQPLPPPPQLPPSPPPPPTPTPPLSPQWPLTLPLPSPPG